MSFVITGRKFRLAPDRDGSCHRAIGGIDRSGVCRAAIESKNAFRTRIVVDGVGILAGGLDGADRFQRFEVEDGNGIGSSIAGEAAAEVTRHRNAMNT